MNDTFTVEKMEEVSGNLRDIAGVMENDVDPVVLNEAADMIDICVKMHHKSEDVIKPCPFDGNKPKMIKKILHRDVEKDQLKIVWELECPHCGISKVKGPSYYKVNDEAKLILTGPYMTLDSGERIVVDSRLKVIEEWNKRCCECGYEELNPDETETEIKDSDKND